MRSRVFPLRRFLSGINIEFDTTVFSLKIDKLFKNTFHKINYGKIVLKLLILLRIFIVENSK